MTRAYFFADDANAKRRALADQRAMRVLEMRSVEGKTYADRDRFGHQCPGSAQDAYRRGVAMSVPHDWENDAKALALQKLDIWEQMAPEQYHAGTRGVLRVGRAGAWKIHLPAALAPPPRPAITPFPCPRTDIWDSPNAEMGGRHGVA